MVSDGHQEQLDIAREFERARNCLVSASVDSEMADRWVRDFNQALRDFERAAWHRGMDLANNWAQNDRERWAALLLQVATAMQGKDRADGYISHSVYPDPRIYDWREEDLMERYIDEEDARFENGTLP